MVLIYILIILFLLLVTYQVILAFSRTNNLIEGLENEGTTNTSTSTSTSTQEYKPYNLNDPNNSLILSQQNAGNIEVLRGRIDKFDGVKEQLDTIQQEVDSMQVQIDGLVQQQADYAQEIAGSTPPDITGTDGETTESVEASIEEEDNP
jgi:hypothetical protein